eukprot:m.80078 g.80078  ORF g.80078 m.80078 type:complete len:225 (-) comp25277_c0_seq1:183-857(-)
MSSHSVAEFDALMQQGTEQIDRWLNDTSRWKAGKSIGGAAFSSLSPSKSEGCRSTRTVWKMDVRLEAPPAKVFSAFVDSMAEICPPGTSYATREQTTEQPWASSGVGVQQLITVSFVGGIVKPREYIDAMKNSPVGADNTLRREGYGLDTDSWPASSSHVRGINYHICFICKPANDGKHTDLTYLNQTAACGWVPGWAVDSALVDEHFTPLLKGMVKFLNIPEP